MCETVNEMAKDEENDGVSTPKPIKATWTADFHEIFLDLCLEQINAGNKPGTHFTRVGWRNIEDSFMNNSGVFYEKKQFKNHWDNTKEQWKVWRKLIGTRSMKWDPDTRKFGASEEEWANYTQMNPEAAQFRYKEPLFLDKLDIIYDGTTITGETERPTRRRKRNGGSGPSGKHRLKIKEPIYVQPESRSERLCDVLDSKSTVTDQSSLGKLCYSIGECIECLDGMEEVEQGSDLYLFALDLFMKKEYREIFLNLKKASVRIAWLQRLQSLCPPLL